MCNELNWKVDGKPFGSVVGSSISRSIKDASAEQFPYFIEMFPFVKHHSSMCYIENKFIIFQIKDDISYGINLVGTLKDKELISLASDIMKNNSFMDYKALKKYLPTQCFTHNVFTYVGPCNNNCISADHVQLLLTDWLNDLAIPYIEDMNKRKVLAAIPTPPNYNLNLILSNIFILESSEIKGIQGTCFNVGNMGLVTCNHTLDDHILLYQANNTARSYTVKIISRNATIDIARIEAPGLILGKSLALGSADTLKCMDHIAIAGFPNYRRGDSGILSPGLIIGYRMVSSIRRLLVNAPIIGGNSGGPVLNGKGEVIGVAVTGADRMEEAGKTENHGVIPIDALSYLK